MKPGRLTDQIPFVTVLLSIASLAGALAADPAAVALAQEATVRIVRVEPTPLFPRPADGQPLKQVARLHLDNILAASQAPIVVVLGARARNLLVDPWRLPAGFGQKETVGRDETVNLARRVLGGRERVVAYAWHPSGMTGPKSMTGAYPNQLATLRRLAQGLLAPADVTIDPPA